MTPKEHSGLIAHLNALAQALESRGNRLALDLFDAHHALDEMYVANQDLRDKLKASNARAEDLRAQLKEFKDARRRAIAVPRKSRRTA